MISVQAVHTPMIRPRKKKLKLTRSVINDLKEISKLSYLNRWEYAGKVERDNFTFSKPEYVTSKCRSCVKSKEIE